MEENVKKKNTKKPIFSVIISCIIRKYKETKKEVQHGQGTAGFRMAGVEDY